MNLELSTEMAAWAAEHGRFVVDGMEHCDRLHNPFHRCGPFCPPFGPDPALVALTEPCETCIPHKPHSTIIDNCPDCEGRGYKLLIVTTECEAAVHDPHWAHPLGCNGEGQIPAFTARVTDVLPVVRYGEHRIVGRYVVIGEHGTPFKMSNEQFPIECDEITLPPDTQPGQYVALIEVVT